MRLYTRAMMNTVSYFLRFDVKVIAVLALACAGANASVVSAADEMSIAEKRDQIIKASFVYNFARFIDWGTEDRTEGDDLKLCVERDDAESAWKSIEGRSVGEGQVAVRFIEDTKDLYEECDIAFITPHQMRRIRLSKLARRGVITISDMKDFDLKGGAIGITNTRGRYGFLVNDDVFETAGARLSSKVLRLQMRVSLPKQKEAP
ncbi:MAG: YfiR family protein [Pseudomonadota bacterium]